MSLADTNFSSAVSCTKRTEYCDHWERLAFAIEALFPSKTAWNLAALTGLKVRACFQFLSRKSSLSSDALVALLDTPHGPEVLKALMGDSDQKWWRQFNLLWERERLKNELEKLEREMSKK